MTRHVVTVVAVWFVLIAVPTVGAQVAGPPPLDLFFAAASSDNGVAKAALDTLAGQWRDSYTPMIIDLARLLRPAPRPTAPSGSADLGQPTDGPDDGDDSGVRSLGAEQAAAPGTGVTRESMIRSRLIAFLEKQTRRRFDLSLNGWRAWMWSLPYEPHPEYARFKGMVYGGSIDQRMQRFFPPGAKSVIRLDEIDWGGVTVNGIPPLYYPKVLGAAQARYLRDSNIVFGVVVNGEARAYPKRVLAWHEMAIDQLGGAEITVVYCTLCGTVIPYDSVVGGKRRGFGTSGLLYRSNKLMFDEETMSLWSTLEGQPVVGPLVGSGLRLTAYAAVTTTWGEWRAEHPDTTVLSLETGHQRDYSEGAAYRDYFSNDRLYFEVPKKDGRLRNKAEVLVMQVRPAAGGVPQPVAIDANFLRRTPVFHFEVAGRRLVVVTSPKGANRVYAQGTHEVVFQARSVAGDLVDTAGRRWQQDENQLKLADGSVALPRYVAQRAFWFGWYAQYPQTLLLGR